MNRRSVRTRVALPVLPVLLGLLAAGCSDFGAPLRPDPAPDGEEPAGPAVDQLLPFRTFPGDTVVVAGRGFGAAPGTVTFAGPAGTRRDATVLSWADDRIRALVPGDAADGPVLVQVGDLETAGVAFETAAPVSFAADVAPLFDLYSCTVCHANGSSSGAFEVLPWSRLVASSAVVPRDSRGSRLRIRLLPSTPLLQRMPEGGPFYLNDAEILVLSDWIDQGARDN